MKRAILVLSVLFAGCGVESISDINNNDKADQCHYQFDGQCIGPDTVLTVKLAMAHMDWFPYLNTLSSYVCVWPLGVGVESNFSKETCHRSHSEPFSDDLSEQNSYDLNWGNEPLLYITAQQLAEEGFVAAVYGWSDVLTPARDLAWCYLPAKTDPNDTSFREFFNLECGSSLDVVSTNRVSVQGYSHLKSISFSLSVSDQVEKFDSGVVEEPMDEPSYPDSGAGL